MIKNLLIYILFIEAEIFKRFDSNVNQIRYFVIDFIINITEKKTESNIIFEVVNSNIILKVTELTEVTKVEDVAE